MHQTHRYLKDIKGTVHTASVRTKWALQLAKPWLWKIAGITLLYSLSGVLVVWFALAARELVDSAISTDRKELVQAVLVFTALLVGHMVLSNTAFYIGTRVRESFEKEMQDILFIEILHKDWARLSVFHSAELQTRFTRDFGNVMDGISRLWPSIISKCVELSVAFFTLMMFEQRLAWLVFCLPPIMLVINQFMVRKLSKWYQEMHQAESQYRKHVQETFENFDIIKTFQLEMWNRNRFQERLQNKKVINIRMAFFVTLSRVFMTVGYWSGYLLAFIWGSVQLAAGVISFGTVTAFVQLSQQVYHPVQTLFENLPGLISWYSAIGRVMVIDGIPKDAAQDAIQVTSSPYGIRMSDVTFAYPGGHNLLDHADLLIQPGETVLLTGPSGKGKTTMLRLLFLLLTPQNGLVQLFDAHGQPVDATTTNRSYLSYVPQGNTLFSGSIRDNILLGDPDATDEQVEQASRDACAWEFITAKADGLDYQIGEDSLGISEGQAQRIAIARALLRRAPILVLDEATSALDAETEEKVLMAIKRRGNGQTCLMITHRLSAAAYCDRHIRLTKGVFECVTANESLPL